MARKGKCNQCGICCKAIPMKESPYMFEIISKDPTSYGYADATFIVNNWEEISQEEAYEINPYLVRGKRFHNGYGYHFYRCKSLIGNKCSIQDCKPRLCERFPYNDNEDDTVNPGVLFTSDCGYRPDVVGEEPL